MCDYKDATNDYYRSQSSPLMPIWLRFATLFKAPPSKVLTFLQEQDSLEFDADEQISGKHQKLNEQKLAEWALAGLIEDKQKDGCDNFGKEAILVDIDI